MGQLLLAYVSPLATRSRQSQVSDYRTMSTACFLLKADPRSPLRLSIHPYAAGELLVLGSIFLW